MSSGRGRSNVALNVVLFRLHRAARSEGDSIDPADLDQSVLQNNPRDLVGWVAVLATCGPQRSGDDELEW